ncbi:MAG: two-component system response regulator, partial [Rhodospirillaceae bacterium]|nr:two-component system response regulator [Rhodospirillaceae bacterium]
MPLIAIIDDQVTNRRIYAKLAGSIMPNAEIPSFSNPIKALEWSKERIPDIVVSDFKIGTMNG